MPDAGDPRRESRGLYPALSLYQLIGAPLHALVDAESQSAQATARFIEEFGFETRPAAAGAQAGGGGLELGDLRMARFRMQRRSPEGVPHDVEVAVPLLSMLPIPALQIQDAELEFSVKIVDVASYGSESGGGQAGAEGADAGPPAAVGEPEQASDLDRLSQRLGQRIQFKGALGRAPSARVEGRQSMEMQVQIKVRVAQADVPAGMARLFNLLEHNIQVTESETAPPPE